MTPLTLRVSRNLLLGYWLLTSAMAQSSAVDYTTITAENFKVLIAAVNNSDKGQEICDQVLRSKRLDLISVSFESQGYVSVSLTDAFSNMLPESDFKNSMALLLLRASAEAWGDRRQGSNPVPVLQITIAGILQKYLPSEPLDYWHDERVQKRFETRTGRLELAAKFEKALGRQPTIPNSEGAFMLPSTPQNLSTDLGSSASPAKSHAPPATDDGNSRLWLAGALGVLAALALSWRFARRK